MEYLQDDSGFTGAAGLLQRCRLLTHSAGTTNKTWSIDDYIITASDITFTKRVIGCGSLTKVEEAELFGIPCAVKMACSPEASFPDPSPVGGPRSLGQPPKEKPEVRNWSLSNHQRSEANVKQRFSFRKFRSHSFEPTDASTETPLSHTSRLSDLVDLDGFKKIMKECRMLSTLHHPNIVQFYGVCWLEQGTEAQKVAIIIEELMLITLKEVSTSFREKLDGDIPLPMKLSLLSDTARGLAYLHSHAPSIIHPNLDSGDIMISSAMVTKITDLSDAQYGSSKQQDVFAFGAIAALILGKRAQELTAMDKRQLSETEANLVTNLVPCFSVDPQSRPTMTKLVSKLEQLAKTVPFQLSQMSTMMNAIKDWRQEMKTHSPTLTEVPPLKVKPSASVEDLLRTKDQQLMELQEKNLELLATNQSIERRLIEQEEQLKQIESGEEIQLSDMLAELHNVVGWFLLGIHLGVPLADLQKIRQQFNENVDQCKTEMIITYSKLMEPSWAVIVEALRKCGEHALATKLSRKHGIPLPEGEADVEFSSNPLVLLNGTDEIESDVKELVDCIKTKDTELQETLQQLQREQATKEELQREVVLLRDSLNSISVSDMTINFQQNRQKLSQQLFLKERERHYLSLMSMGQQNHKDKNMNGNEIDFILIEKDMEINRMKAQLKEMETQFRTEKIHSEELKTKLTSLESELTIKEAHISELEKSKEEINKYLAEERHRVDMLLMRVVPPPSPRPASLVSLTVPVPTEKMSLELEAVSNVNNLEPRPVKNCCVIV